METWIRNERLYTGKIFSLRVGEVRLDDGRVAGRDVVEHPGGVAIVPVLDDSVILVRQFRISIEREIIELPAGRLEDGEAPEISAARELEEELGYLAGRMILATSYFSTVGFTNEKMYIYLAFDLQETEAKPEWDERIESIKIPISEIETKLSNNEFEDSKTIIGLRELRDYYRRT